MATQMSEHFVRRVTGEIREPLFSTIWLRTSGRRHTVRRICVRLKNISRWTDTKNNYTSTTCVTSGHVKLTSRPHLAMTTWRRLYCESSRDSQSASHLRKHHAIISQLSATSIFGTAYRRNHSQFNYATSLLTERDIRYIAQTRTVLQDGNTPLRPPTIHLLQVRPPSYTWSKLVQIILDTHPYSTFCI